MKLLTKTHEDKNEAKILKILKGFSLINKFKKKSEIDEFTSLKNKNKKVWSFPNLFNSKQKPKSQAQRKTHKPNSYYEQTEMFCSDVFGDIVYEKDVVENQKKSNNSKYPMEDMVAKIQQKSLKAIISEAKLELRKRQQTKTLLLDCNYVPIEDVELSIAFETGDVFHIHEKKYDYQCESLSLESDYVYMSG